MRMKSILIILISVHSFLLIYTKELTANHEFNEIFSIYISDSTYYQNELDLNEIQLSDEPLLVAQEITKYKWSTHEILFSSSVHEKLKTRGNLLHKVFVVVAFDQKIYWGKFMDDLDSGVCQNPVIRLLWRHPDGRNTTPSSFCIERAYPDYFGSENDPDIRNNQIVYQALLEAGILDDATSLKDENIVNPFYFELLQNYPNPFNPVTNISYQLQKNSIVNLAVFDISGQEVLTLVDKRQNAGKYSVSFDATSFPSGIYIYRIKVDHFEQSRKMVLIK